MSLYINKYYVGYLLCITVYLISNLLPTLYNIIYLWKKKIYNFVYNKTIKISFPY